MSQNIIVGLIVGIAAAYAVWRIMPASSRQSLAKLLGDTARSLGLSETRAKQITSKLESSGGCGSCDSCKACATPAENSGQPIHLHK